MPFSTQRYHLGQIKPGMVLGQPILNAKGKILLSEGTLLNESLLEQLFKLGVEEITIRETEPVQNNLIPLDEPKLQLISQAVHEMKESFKIIERSGKVPFKNFQHIAHSNIWPIVVSYSAINYLNIERIKSDYLYDHSVNVGLLSGLIAKWSGYPPNEIGDLILTGLLHDIGKTQISKTILNKPEKLSVQEMEAIQFHPTYSFNLVNKMPTIPSDVKIGILQHHERLDGSGYPGHFKENKIHRYARIVAIADIYDAMTSERDYRHKTNPFMVADALSKDMYSKLDAKLCTTFLTQFCNFIIGNTVQLEDGREGEIVSTGHFLDFKPIIRTVDGEFLTISNWNSITNMRPLCSAICWQE